MYKQARSSVSQYPVIKRIYSRLNEYPEQQRGYCASPGDNCSIETSQKFKVNGQLATCVFTSFDAQHSKEAVYHHDLCYAKHGDTKTRNEVCDKAMLQDFENIYNPSLRERFEIGLLTTLIKSKVNLGLGLKKAEKGPLKWSDQLAEELGRPVDKNFRKRKV